MVMVITLLTPMIDPNYEETDCKTSMRLKTG